MRRRTAYFSPPVASPCSLNRPGPKATPELTIIEPDYPLTHSTPN